MYGKVGSNSLRMMYLYPIQPFQAVHILNNSNQKEKFLSFGKDGRVLSVKETAKYHLHIFKEFHYGK